MSHPPTPASPFGEIPISSFTVDPVPDFNRVPDLDAGASCLPALMVDVAVLVSASRRHDALAGEAYSIEQHLRGAWMRLDGGWQSYAREDVETYCASALNELTRTATMLRQLGESLACAGEHIDAADVRAAQVFDGAAFVDVPLAAAVGQSGDGDPRESWSSPPFFSAQPDAIEPAPVRYESGGVAPGVDISTEETALTEACVESSCLAMTMQGSGSITPDGSIGSIGFQIGSRKPNNLELVLGSIGGVPLGRLAFSMAGSEWTMPLPGAVMESRLADGSILRVHGEVVESGASVYTDRAGVRHIATMSGMKYVATLAAMGGAVSFADAVTVRQYAWRDPRRRPFMEWFVPKSEPERAPEREPSAWKWPKLPQIPLWPLMPILP